MNTDITLDLNERHGLAIRIWHWTFFLVLTASLITVGLASTVFRTRNNIALVQSQLQKKGVIVDQDQARAVAHEFNDKLWGLHTWLGYILCFFLLARLIIEIALPGDETLRTRIRTALAFKPAPRQQGEQQHYLLVKRGYLLFYAAILVMALTGLVLAFEDVPLFRQWRAPVKSLHAFVQYIIYGYIVLHIAGVIRADIGRYPGIVSGMIHGKKRG